MGCGDWPCTRQDGYGQDEGREDLGVDGRSTGASQIFHCYSLQRINDPIFSDGTIVSGDSLGMVKFWDSRTCTQLQSFQGHGADVLCLTISPVSSSPRAFAH